MDRNDHRFAGFERTMEHVRSARGVESAQAMETGDPWEEMTKGNNLGKSVPIRFVGGGFGGSLTVASAEVLRIMARGERQNIVKQVCLTVSPPQIADLVAAGNPPPPSIQGQDALDLAAVGAVGGTTGGFPVGPDSIANDIQFANAIVSVEWGVGTVRNRAFIDCASGLTVNLVTSWLIVTAFIEQPIGFTPTPAVYVIGANVGPGTPRGNDAQRTLFCGFAANGVATSVFVIPRFAKTIRVAGTDGQNPSALPVGTIQFYADAANVISKGDFAFNGNQTNPIPIPNGAYFFRILSGYNQASGAAPGFSAIFNLTI